MKTEKVKTAVLKALATVAKPQKADPNYPFECIALYHQPKRPIKKG